MMGYVTTKTFTHETGLSCCFRQWRADSHCAQLHGYALAVELEFAATQLDERNWVIDFGGLKPVKAWLQEQFDHTLVIAQDDPQAALFNEMQAAGVCVLRVLPSVGCEAFAKYIYGNVRAWLSERNLSPRVALRKVTVREHGGNACSYEP
jgi:6-pyruvoyltetrahydropterin/6-carboxytetrahydropterin synthase